MIFITGTALSGKSACVRACAQILEDGSSPQHALPPSYIDDAHLLLTDPGAPSWEQLAEELVQQKAVAMAGLGCSLIPMDPALQRWQHDSGRLACVLAARADCVVRMVCGIPQLLKGKLPVPLQTFLPLMQDIQQSLQAERGQSAGWPVAPDDAGAPAENRDLLR